MSRRVLLQAGAAAVVAGGLAGRAAAAPPDGDLAFVRLLLATELLADDFYGRVETPALRFQLAQAAACEAQHLGVFSGELHNRPIGVSFPPALTIDQASNALDAYAG
jgi:hypothetical protein